VHVVIRRRARRRSPEDHLDCLSSTRLRVWINHEVPAAERRRIESRAGRARGLPGVTPAAARTEGVVAESACFIRADALLAHWQGHRRLTRRVVDAFPDDRLFTFSLGGMRPFGELTLELLSIGLPMIRGIVTDEWTPVDKANRTKAALLELWDADTTALDAFWRELPPGRFEEIVTSFGQYTSPVHDQVLYAIENEIHHRGQGYVYLRALGIEPPPFYLRD
jgi:uncharacterized damage-inducible protein DinB